MIQPFSPVSIADFVGLSVANSLTVSPGRRLSFISLHIDARFSISGHVLHLERESRKAPVVLCSAAVRWPLLVVVS